MKSYSSQLIVSLLLLLSSTLLQAAPLIKTYTLGIYSYLPKPMMIKRYQPLVDYLNSQLTSYRLKLQILGIDEIETALENKQLDFLFTNPRHYSFLRHKYQFSGAIATLIKQSKTGATTPSLAGVIFTRRDKDNINQLADIKGRLIATPSTKHMGGYLTQAYELLQAGIELPGDARLIEVGTHKKVVQIVLSGKADIGFVRSEILENLNQNGKLALSQIKVINRQNMEGFPFISSTRLYPEWPFIALSHVNIKVVSRIASLLLTIGSKQTAIHKAGIAGFTPPADYSPVEEVARALRLPPHEHGPDFTLADIWERHKSGIFILLLLVVIVGILFVLLLRRNQIIIGQQQQIKKEAQQSQQIITATQVGTWEWNVQTDETVFNERWAELIGYTLEELSPYNIETWEDLTHADDLIVAKQKLEQHFNGQTEFYETDFRMRHKSGHWVWINDRGQVVEWTKEGKPLWMSGTHTNISERKQTEEQIRLAATVFSNSQEGILICDKNNCIVDVNPACLALTGYTREEVMGENPSLFSAGTQSPEFYQKMWQVLNKTGQWQGDILNRKKSGAIYSERLTINTVVDEKSQLQHYVAVFYDISYLKEHQAQLEHIAYNDALTGLPNRLLLRDRMQQAIAKVNRDEKLLAVCYLDLDGFKPVNDNYGHKAGDVILVEVAQRLQKSVRTEDTVARIGGDEFVLLVYTDSIAKLKQVLERVLVTISSPYSLPEGDTEATPELIPELTLEQRGINTISASMGLTLYPLDESDADMLLRHADQAMYSAKQGGKNRYSFFDAKVERKVTEEHRIQQEIRGALEQQEFLLYYQPKVNMHSGEVIGVEALIRWQHPQKGLLPPGAFLPSIELTPLMIDIGNWVLQQALLQMRLWKSQGVDLKVSVNIDAMQLQQEDFVACLKSLLDEFNELEPSHLELEILETSALHDIERVSQIIEACKQLGVEFSLDDFGTGYSSLTYLKQLPAQTLKIDQSFIRNLLESSEDMAIIEGILGLAHAFHRSAIAEGVETIHIGTLLLNLGCQLAQGYAIARPMPAEKIPQWLTQFKIPTQWQDANNSLNCDANYSVTLMYLNHHHIVSRVRHAIEQKASSLIPEHYKQHHSCEIGKWLEGEGKQRYSQFKEFKLLVDKHKRIHHLIKQVTELLSDVSDNDKLQTNSIELNQLSSDMLDCLNQLRKMAIK